MAESEQQTNTETGTVKTAADLEIEKLNARLDGIEKTYQARIKELEEANKGLWAQLHPAQTTQTAQTAPAEDPGEKALFDALGLKN